jgi:hypothetical protein
MRRECAGPLVHYERPSGCADTVTSAWPSAEVLHFPENDESYDVDSSDEDLDGMEAAVVRFEARREQRAELEARGLLRTSSRMSSSSTCTFTLNILLLVDVSAWAFNLKVSHAPISVRLRVLNDPPARWRRGNRKPPRMS